MQGFHPAFGQVAEQALVEGSRRFATVGRTVGIADDVVLDIRRQGRQYAFDVVLRFEAEVLIDPAIHFLARHCHGRTLRQQEWLPKNLMRHESHGKTIISI
ncbi:hypothetical protein D9M71_696500 [compost metagenome]